MIPWPPALTPCEPEHGSGQQRRLAGGRHGQRSEASADPKPLGSGPLRHHRHSANGADAGLRCLQQCRWRPRRHFDPCRDGRDGLHRDELRPHGQGVSQRGFRLHVRGPGTAPLAGLCDGLEHDDGLHSQSSDLHGVVGQGYGGPSEGTRYQIPYPGLLWPIFFAVLFTALNLRGVRPRPESTRCSAS